MFIDIDYEKQLQKAKLHLAKPNKQIIDILPEKFNDTLNVELGGVSELSFSLPYYLSYDEEGNPDEESYNEHIDKVKEKMLIRVTLGSYQEWFIIDEADESSSDNDTYNVTAFSLPYELTHRHVSEFIHDSINATTALNRLLERYAWSVGYVDPTFDKMKRSFDENDTNAMDIIETIRETYGALIIWNSHNRTISLHMFEKYGRYKGLNVSHGRLLQSVSRKITTDELVTRLWVEGSEELTINSVNPTGQSYIEDFSYFMHPFERDSNRNVIKSSDYMSDDLCHALLDQNIAIDKYYPQIKNLQEQLSIFEGDRIEAISILDDLEIDMNVKLELLDVAKASENEQLITQKKIESDEAIYSFSQQENRVASIESSIEIIKNNIEILQDSVIEESGFTEELFNELNESYIFEKTWKDDRYIDVQELYDDGLKEFKKHQEPKIVIETEIDNFMDAIEEQYYWDKLVIGDRVKIKYPRMKIDYMATLVEFQINLSARTISLTLANTNDLLNSKDDLAQLLSQTKSASTAIENNKYKWDKVNAIENEFNDILLNEWDASKRRIIAGANNSIDISGRGILVRSPDRPNEMLIIQSGILSISEDGGETWKTAVRSDGVVAERLIGKIIAGQELIITNRKGSFTLDTNGFRVKGLDFVVENSTGDGNLVDEWNKTGDFVEDFRSDNIITGYEKGQLKDRWTELKIKYEFIDDILDDYYDNGGMDNPQVVELHSAYNRLYNYLFVDEQGDGYALLDAGNSDNATRIDRELFTSRFNDLRNQLPVVEEIIHRRSIELIKEAQEEADKARKEIEEIENDTVWKIELSSSRGTMFTNNNIETTITATVYKGSENYTNNVPIEGFIWKKRDKDGNWDLTWNASHIGVGNVITIDEDDVFKKAIFSCDIDLGDDNE